MEENTRRNFKRPASGRASNRKGKSYSVIVTQKELNLLHNKENFSPKPAKGFVKSMCRFYNDVFATKVSDDADAVDDNHTNEYVRNPLQDLNNRHQLQQQNVQCQSLHGAALQKRVPITRVPHQALCQGPHGHDSKSHRDQNSENKGIEIFSDSNKKQTNLQGVPNHHAPHDSYRSMHCLGRSSEDQNSENNCIEISSDSNPKHHHAQEAPNLQQLVQNNPPLSPTWQSIKSQDSGFSDSGESHPDSDPQNPRFNFFYASNSEQSSPDSSPEFNIYSVQRHHHHQYEETTRAPSEAVRMSQERVCSLQVRQIYLFIIYFLIDRTNKNFRAVSCNGVRGARGGGANVAPKKGRKFSCWVFFWGGGGRGK